MDTGHKLGGVFVDVGRLELSPDGGVGTGEKAGYVAIGKLELLMETIDYGHALLGTKIAKWPVETVFSIEPYAELDCVGSRFVPPPVLIFNVLVISIHFVSVWV